MSAEMLREAASVLRERAEAAIHGPWGLGSDKRVTTEVEKYGTALVTEPVRRGDAAYIATVHPAVGLALADWLDVVAAGREAIDGITQVRSRNGGGWLGPDPASEVFIVMEDAALAVAAAILGRSA